jgi:hypothetical protein
MPLRTSSQEISEFEFHMSPVPSSSRPQTSAGTEGTSSSSTDARSGSAVTRVGLAIACARSGMTPSRQRRTSYRNNRKRPAMRVPTAPSTTTPRRAPSPSGTGVISMT